MSLFDLLMNNDKFLCVVAEPAFRLEKLPLGVGRASTGLSMGLLLEFSILCVLLETSPLGHHLVNNKTQGLQLRTASDSKINPLINHVNTRGTYSDKTYYYNI